MEMYTKLECNIKIKKDEELIKILNYMLNLQEEIFEIPDHQLFSLQDNRWKYMLCCCSCCFTNTSFSDLREDYDNYVLHIDCDLKNYNEEIDNFLDWISGYATGYDEYELIGYTIYEENSIPTLIYMNKDGYKYVNLYKYMSIPALRKDLYGGDNNEID